MTRASRQKRASWVRKPAVTAASAAPVLERGRGLGQGGLGMRGDQIVQASLKRAPDIAFRESLHAFIWEATAPVSLHPPGSLST
jgi:hypothetical protein